jgi:hypothetical protein
MVYVILEWKWDLEQTTNESFKVCGVFTDEEIAVGLLDKLQMNSYLNSTNNYYWLEPMEIDELQEQLHELQ